MSPQLLFAIGSFCLLGGHFTASACVYRLAVARWRRLDPATMGAVERKRAGQRTLNWLVLIMAVSVVSLVALTLRTMAR